MIQDVRDRPSLSEADVLALNFIRRPARYVFRRHYRVGLRSHIMEVLRPEDVAREREGVTVDGVTWFSRARPLRMLRIFRTRFRTLNDAEAEVRRVKVIETYLDPDHFARSEEFLVDYVTGQQKETLLCGLQEFVEGEILEPWSALDRGYLLSLFLQMDCSKTGHSGGSAEEWLLKLRRRAASFITQIKKMVVGIYHIPDLAGVGNLLVTPTGTIKLVDINNVSPVKFRPEIELDDRGYPVCDKSIEALSLLEENLVGAFDWRGDSIYRCFLIPERMREVEALVKEFHPSPPAAPADHEPS
jgi:hypothetical protein